MARFVPLIRGDGQAWAQMGPEEERRVEEGHRAFAAAAGDAVVDGGEVDGSSPAACLRPGPGGDPEVGEVSPAPGGLVLGGYYVLDVPDLDEALRLAALLPEVRAAYPAAVEVMRLRAG